MSMPTIESSRSIRKRSRTRSASRGLAGSNVELPLHERIGKLAEHETQSRGGTEEREVARAEWPELRAHAGTKRA
jgi:hypothetical protein